MQEEGSDHRAPLDAAKRERPLAVADLQRAENPKLHTGTKPPASPRGQPCSVPAGCLRYFRVAVDASELQRKADLAELLLHVARELGETLEPERVYDRFHELLRDAVEHDGIVVSTYDEADGLIRCEYAWVEGNRLDPTLLPPLEINREGGGMQSQVILTGEPLLANDVAERVQDEGGTYYDVDREGTIRKLPDSGPPAGPRGHDGAGAA